MRAPSGLDAPLNTLSLRPESVASAAPVLPSHTRAANGTAGGGIAVPAAGDLRRTVRRAAWRLRPVRPHSGFAAASGQLARLQPFPGGTTFAECRSGGYPASGAAALAVRRGNLLTRPPLWWFRPMTASVPRVSVLMTTRDGAGTISESIASILTQDMPDFELIVVDDASSDDTPVLLRATADPRLILIRNEARLGIAGARNRGLARCRAPYIATIDHDDLSDPRRLSLQAAYLDAHPDIVLVGTAVHELRNGKVTPEDQPTRISPPLLRLLLHLDNPLAWSSVMMRAEALRALDPPPLRPVFEPADDFDLYHRLLARGGIARLDAPLTTYRWHMSNTSYTAGVRSTDAATRVLARAYAPWFGTEAAAAAALVVRHSNDRVAVTNVATMTRLRDIVRRVADGLVAAHPTEQPAIIAGTRLVLWRLTRAAVRSGHPSLFRPPAPPLDASLSLAVGSIRAGFALAGAQVRRPRLP